jgi:hypothetical protein
MNLSRRASHVAVLLLLIAPSVRAQIPAGPAGHWQGSIQIPGREVVFELDLVQNRTGDFTGTTSLPAERIKGLPIRSVVVAGTSVIFDVRRDQPFRGVLSADGKMISGDTTLSGYVLPFSMVRTGEAEITPPVKSEPIGDELEGSWNGTLDANGTTMRFVLKLANQSDGTATAFLLSLDEGELELPLVVTQKASSVTLVNNFIKSSFSGTLNPDGTAVTGTFTQGSATMPMVFKRAAK